MLYNNFKSNVSTAAKAITGQAHAQQVFPSETGYLCYYQSHHFNVSGPDFREDFRAVPIAVVFVALLEEESSGVYQTLLHWLMGWERDPYVYNGPSVVHWLRKTFRDRVEFRMPFSEWGKEDVYPFEDYLLKVQTLDEETRVVVQDWFPSGAKVEIHDGVFVSVEVANQLWNPDPNDGVWHGDHFNRGLNLLQELGFRIRNWGSVNGLQTIWAYKLQ